MEAPGSPESERPEGPHPGGTPGDEAGRIVGERYRILRQLGAGGMGAVYLCEHVALGRRYAVKVLRGGPVPDPDLARRFRQEATAASRIVHENVVQVVDFGEDGGDLYYVMELLQGRPLSRLMREEGPLPLPRALALLEQVCRALAAAHAAGVIHRDVKPDNVLVERLPDGSERAKLIDFGISHLPAAGRLTRAGEIIGTPEYMAPEQAAGAEVDAQTDVYAAGVLAFELLTGTLPLLGATPIATLVAHQTQPPPAPSTRRPLPPAVDGLVLRALAKDKAARFATMQALAADVLRVRVSASLAPADAPAEGRWPDEASGTGRGGTIGLAAVPYPQAAPAGVAGEADEAGEAPAWPAPAAAAAGGRWRWRRRTVALGAVALALLAAAAAALLWAAAGAPPSSSVTVSLPSVPPPAAQRPPVRQAPAAERAAPAPPPPRRIDDDPAPGRPAPRPRPEPLRDPYAAPGDPLKPDPFR